MGNNNVLRLIDEKTGKEVKPGDKVTTFRGETFILSDFDQRRVYVKGNAEDVGESEYFPSVINCKVVGGPWRGSFGI